MYKILVCDDDREIVEVIEIYLSQEGYQILKAYDGIEAENVELQRILEDDDMNAYMKKLAIEDMNYAYPDERRYYDTSRN